MYQQIVKYYIIKWGKFLLVVVLFIVYPKLFGQTYSLEQLIHYAQENAPEAMKIKTSKENKYWHWKTYKSEYKPQLVLNTTLPSYQNNNIPVTQEDGSIVYRNINRSQAYAGLSLEQNIGLTGGTLYFSSDLSRLDDFNQLTNSYSGSPVYLGIQQPLFAFNHLKWMNRIEPLKYEESHKEYMEGNEEIAYNTTIRYFNLLISQVNYRIASANKANADTIYKIGKEKYAMGKISKNELLQLKYGEISALKYMATASLSIKTSLLELCSYSGIKESGNIMLTLPDSIFRFDINDSVAVKKAQENSLNSIIFKRKLLEAKRDAEQANRESGLNASLSVSYGQTNIAGTVHGMYEKPQTLQTLNLGLTVPILDWGRAKAKRKTAEANLKLSEYTLQQDEINFKQQVITEVENFRMLQDFIGYTAEADQTAAERYQIARLRYIAGNISLTDYNIALEEKDLSRQDYIIALRDYWLAYYSIRILTLYDFRGDKSLITNNE